jgi:hypothetical protein
MTWTVEVLNATVRAELEAQPKDIRARYLRIVELIESHGWSGLGSPTSSILKVRFGRCA